MPDKGPELYSTNPNTIKARRRKMSLNGAKKVEDAARTADYKAMIYARKVVQAKPEYQSAPEPMKSAMLESAMRETMEKRRARGQDTMSKMAAFNAGLYHHRSGTTGPQTRVPISAFLEDNGYVPAQANRNSRHSTTASAGSDTLNGGPVGGGNDPFSSAPEADMGGANTTLTAEGINGHEALRERSAPAIAPMHPGVGHSANGNLSTPAHSHSRRSSSLFVSQIPTTPNGTGVKTSHTPSPPANVTRELNSLSVMPSIEGAGEGDDPFALLRNEVVRLRTICQHVLASNQRIRKHENSNFGAEMDMDQGRVQELDQRVSQLEGRVHALQSTAVTAVAERVGALEQAVEDLKGKVGDGAAAEVAKMREVMGSLREALGRVGNFP